jgi:hypothetical protein
MAWTSPFRALMSPITSPMNSEGERNVNHMIGIQRPGSACVKPSRNAVEAAIL